MNSACNFDLAAPAASHRFRLASATLVGQATGGNLRGLNGGQLAWLTLPTSGVAVDIPLIASMAKTAQPDRGVEPDLAVTTRIEDVIAGRDPDMVASMRVLRRL